MYRTEQDALNALVEEQRKTNELLQKLVNHFDKPKSENKQNATRPKQKK